MEDPKFKWCREVTEQVRFKPDRNKIWDELMDHIEDRAEDMKCRGYTEEEAESRAVSAMGDPAEVGRQLNAVHKPWLGWLWIVSKVLVIVLLVTALTFVPGIVENYKDELESEREDWVGFGEENTPVGSDIINLYDLDLTGEIDGYRFTVDKVAWQGQSSNGIQLYILMDIRRQPFAPALTRKALEKFTIVDDRGLQMGVDEFHPENFDPVIGLYGAGIQYDDAEANDPLQGRCVLMFHALRWEPEWVELYCEYDGRTITFRIPGPGGGEG